MKLKKISAKLESTEAKVIGFKVPTLYADELKEKVRKYLDNQLKIILKKQNYEK